jgi:MFS family permease
MSRADSAPPTYRSVLRIKGFRSLAIASGTSEIGDWLYNIALLVYVFGLTHSPTWVGMATIGRLLPYALFSPIGGLLADRFGRLRMMHVSNLARLAIFAGMTAAVAFRVSAGLVILLAAIGTVAGVPYRPASSALLPELVDESRLASAMAVLSTGYSVALVAGPAIGAAILALGPPALAFAINAATFGVSSLLLLAISLPERHPVGRVEAPPSAWRMFLDGLRAVRETPYVPVITAMCMVGAAGYGAETVLLVVYAEERLGQGADGYGYLIAAAGVGGTIAGALCGRLAGRPRIAGLVTLGGGILCFSMMLYVATSELVVAMAIAGVSGVAMVVADVVSDVAIVRASANELLGRIYGAFEGTGVLATVAGALIAPVVSNLLGNQRAMLLIGGVTTVLTLAAFPTLRRLDRVTAVSAATRSRRVEMLSDVAVFRGAAPPALERLAEDASEQVIPAGAEVVTQGAAADAFYVVVDGDLEVWSTGEGGGERTFVRTLGPGDWFGEIGLLEATPRTATVRSVTKCLLLRISGEAFLEALTAHPNTYGALRETAAARLALTHPARTAGAAKSP